jgi:mRNA interferase MazF
MENNFYIKVRRGDIIWLKDDISINLGDNVQDTSRPYIVISNDKNNRNNRCPIVNLACLTKQTHKANFPMHVLISGEKYGLDFDSVIYAEQLITVNKSMIQNKIASLDKEDLKRVNRAIYIQVINEKVPAII